MTARTVGVVAALVAAAAAACAVQLVRGDVDLAPSAAARLLAGSTVSAGWALALVVVLPLAVTAVAGWRRSSRTGDLAVLTGAALLGAVLVQVQVLRTFSWVQPVGLACGALLVVLGLRVRSRRVERPPGGGPRALSGHPPSQEAEGSRPRHEEFPC